MRLRTLSSLAFVIGLVAACGSSNGRSGFGEGEKTDPTLPSGGGFDPSKDAGAPGDLGHDPETCDEAKQARTYIGCDYWPTVVANNVWSVFDYAVVVSNVGKNAADVTVTGPNNVSHKVSVAPGTLEKIY